MKNNMKWTLVRDGLPDKHIVGDKVLLYRISNESQNSNAMTVHDTFMVKNCDPDETWWMPLPDPPLMNESVREIIKEEVLGIFRYVHK